jgi:hypothetical protein
MLLVEFAMAPTDSAAIHEAGHAVACLILGIPMVAVTVADGFYLHRRAASALSA